MIIIPATIAVGYYDWGYNVDIHVFAAQTTLAGILFFVLTWTLADFFLNDTHPYKVKSKMKTDLAVSAFIILCSYTQIGLPVPAIMLQFISLQIYQKAAIYSALIYLAVIAMRLISMMKQSNSNK